MIGMLAGMKIYETKPNVFLISSRGYQRLLKTNEYNTWYKEGIFSHEGSGSDQVWAASHGGGDDQSDAASLPPCLLDVHVLQDLEKELQNAWRRVLLRRENCAENCKTYVLETK